MGSFVHEIEMGEFSARMRVAKSLLTAFQGTPGFTHIAASECEALGNELEGAEMTTSQVADCMEEVRTLGFDISQERALLEMFR